MTSELSILVRQNMAKETAKVYFTIKITAIMTVFGKTTACTAEVLCMTVTINCSTTAAGTWTIFTAKAGSSTTSRTLFPHLSIIST